MESKSHYQSFSFRSTLHPTSSSQLASQNKNKFRVQYIIENAGTASYAKAFHGYDTFFSHSPFEPATWKRIETHYDEVNGWLIWNHEATIDGSSNSVYFAYFPPYSYERHLGLIAKCAGTLVEEVAEYIIPILI